ncbi:GNAT family N-acetyltransferase [Paenibacillus sanfengchensis]|uniref:GNAT family N-acetyltransferase n=1 Tax=Paenibacillus sanfengchensis TaxID=3119819 RepID=UPI002FE1E3E8
MDKLDDVELVHLAEEHFAELNKFELPDEQRQFTALPSEVLNVTEGQYPIVILDEGVAVGFFLLHATDRVKDYTANPNAMLLTALSINSQQQRKGYARKGMLELPLFVRKEFERCDEVVLVVNHKNIPAQQLYLKVGFVDTGERRMGPIGEQIVMSLSIA